MSDDPRYELLSVGPDDGDWGEVVKRARRARHRSQIYAAVVLIALTIVGIASAYATGHPVIDFNKAETAPAKVIDDYEGLDISAPPGMATGVIPNEARQIPGLYLDGKEWKLSVAPTKDGGFCMNGGCTDHKTLAGSIDVEVAGLGSSDGEVATETISGSFTEENADRIVISFADGSSAEIPFVWVTAPINAGFYVFGIAKEHLDHSRRPVEIELLDGGGNVLAKAPVSDLVEEMAAVRTVRHDLPGYPRLGVPVKAIWSRWSAPAFVDT